MNSERKLLVIIILVGLMTFILIPTTLGLLTSTKTLIGSSLVLGACTYLGFVSWFMDR